jgi:hypothetical protein
MTADHVTNWDLLWFAAGGYTLCWLRRDRRLTRLARRVRHFEGQWRLCRVARDRASEAAARYRRLADARLVEIEQLTGDLAAAVAVAQDARRDLARAISHPSQQHADRELFARLEQDFADRNDT